MAKVNGPVFKRLKRTVRIRQEKINIPYGWHTHCATVQLYKKEYDVCANYCAMFNIDNNTTAHYWWWNNYPCVKNRFKGII